MHGVPPWCRSWLKTSLWSESFLITVFFVPPFDSVPLLPKFYLVLLDLCARDSFEGALLSREPWLLLSFTIYIDRASSEPGISFLDDIWRAISFLCGYYSLSDATVEFRPVYLLTLLNVSGWSPNSSESPSSGLSCVLRGDFASVSIL